MSEIKEHKNLYYGVMALGKEISLETIYTAEYGNHVYILYLSLETDFGWLVLGYLSIM